MSYLAKMRQGYDGVWAAQLPYAIEAHPGIPLLYLFYTLLGRVSRWTGLSLPLLYHTARVVCTCVHVQVYVRVFVCVLCVCAVPVPAHVSQTAHPTFTHAHKHHFVGPNQWWEFGLPL